MNILLFFCSVVSFAIGITAYIKSTNRTIDGLRQAFLDSMDLTFEVLRIQNHQSDHHALDLMVIRQKQFHESNQKTIARLNRVATTCIGLGTSGLFITLMTHLIIAQ